MNIITTTHWFLNVIWSNVSEISNVNISYKEASYKFSAEKSRTVDISEANNDFECGNWSYTIINKFSVGRSEANTIDSDRK